MIIKNGLAIGLLLLSACTSHKIEQSKNLHKESVVDSLSTPKDIKSSPLEGEWIWQSSTGGFAAVKKTYKDGDPKKILKITKDSLFYFQQDSLTAKTAYTIKVEKVIESSKKSPVIFTANNKLSFQISNDSLILKEQCYDCFVHLYIKENTDK